MQRFPKPFNAGRGRGGPRTQAAYKSDPAPTEEVEYTHGPKTSAKPKPYKAPSRVKRDAERNDRFREKVGEKEMKGFKEELDKTLFFGFNMETDAIEKQKISVAPQAKMLPVTTRAIGITVQSMFIKINQTMTKIPECTVYEAYRVSLAQFEMKNLCSTRNRVMNVNVDFGNYHNTNLTLDAQQLIRGCPVNFNVIASVINAIGNFEYRDVQYYCGILIQTVPEPTTVTYNNLAATVRALANPATPRNVRQYFYEHNPLPGARWSGLTPRGRRVMDFDVDPILENPNDFWPENYNTGHLGNDISKYQGFLSHISRKAPKYVNLKSIIDFDGPGLKTSLMSNSCQGLKNADPCIIDNKIEWRHTAMPIGDLDEFWSPEPIDDVTSYIGSLQLLGETSKITDHVPETRIRSVEISATRMAHRWTAMFYNMMG